MGNRGEWKEIEAAEKCNSGRRKARVNRLSDEKGYRFSGTRTDFSPWVKIHPRGSTRVLPVYHN